MDKIKQGERGEKDGERKRRREKKKKKVGGKILARALNSCPTH